MCAIFRILETKKDSKTKAFIIYWIFIYNN